MRVVMIGMVMMMVMLMMMVMKMMMIMNDDGRVGGGDVADGHDLDEIYYGVRPS